MELKSVTFLCPRTTSNIFHHKSNYVSRADKTNPTDVVPVVKVDMSNNWENIWTLLSLIRNPSDCVDFGTD